MTPTRRWQILAACFLVFLALGSRLGRTHTVPSRTTFDGFPGEVAGAQSSPVKVSNEALRVLDLTDYLSRIYLFEGRPINVYIGYHGSQRRGSIIHSPRHCLPGNGWYIRSRSLVPLPGAEDGSLVNRMEVEMGPRHQIVYYWYQGRGRRIADEFESTLYRSLDVALTNRSDEALVRFGINGIDEEAEGVLRKFIAEIVPLLPEYLPS